MKDIRKLLLSLLCAGVCLLLPTAAHADGPDVSGVLTAPSTISVFSTVGATVSVYKIKDGSTSCAETDINGAGAALKFNPGGGSVNSFVTTATTTVFTLSAPASATDVLCLIAFTTAGGTTNRSIVQRLVAPPAPSAIPASEPPFAHSFYTVGVVVSNQLSTNNSPTAAQYVDAGFAFKFWNEDIKKKQKKDSIGDVVTDAKRQPVDKYPHTFGFNTSLSGRLTSIPVAASPATGATATSPSFKSSSSSGLERAADTSATSVASSLNVLSSQQSARVMGTAFLPVKVGPRQTPEGDSLYLGPVGKASFSTLLNPSTTVAPATGTSLVSPQFSPTYDDWSLGGRVGWRRYANDGAIQTVWQIDTTIGKFTNLQDIFCNHKFGTAGQTAPTNTNCYDTPVTTTAAGTTTTTYTTYRTDRVSNPRIEVDGFAHIPATIFVVGIDANLSQYGYHHPDLDSRNHAGSDVRIYFGVSGSLAGLFKKLTLPTP